MNPELLEQLNTHFDGRHLLTDGQYEILMQRGQVFKTKARFDKVQALTYLRPLSEEDKEKGVQELIGMGWSEQYARETYYEPSGTYGGYLFTRAPAWPEGDNNRRARPEAWAEAHEWVERRGMGEELCGPLGGVVQHDESENRVKEALN